MIMKKYQNLSIELKATIWFFLCNVLQKGIQYLTLPLFSRILSVEEYGDYVVFISWLSVISIFATLNLSAGMYMTGMAIYEEKRDEFTTNMIGLSLVTTVVVGCIYFMAYNPLNYWIQLSKEYVVVIFIHSFFSPLFLFWSAHERFELKYKELTVVTVLGTLISPIVSLILVLNMTDRALAICIGYISGQVCMGIYCAIKQLKKSLCLFNKLTWKEALFFNIPLIPHYLSYVILGQSDRVMISSMCGQYDAGIYGFAYQISNAINMLTAALDSAFVPQIYKEIKEQKNSVAKKINNVLALYVVIAFLVALMAPEIVLFFGSQKYIEAKWVMPSIILSSYFLFLAGLFMKVEFYFKKNVYITSASTAVAITNIVLNYIFIQRFGYMAASYTTLFCYACFAVVHYFFMRKVMNQNKLSTSVYDGRTILFLSMVVVVAIFIILWVYELGIYMRYGIILLLLLVLIANKKRLLDFVKL